MNAQRPQHAPPPRMERMEREPMRVDRTITLGLVFAVMVQTCGALIWAGAAEARLSTLEMQIALTPGVSERLARLEGQTDQMAQSLSRIERELTKPR